MDFLDYFIELLNFEINKLEKFGSVNTLIANTIHAESHYEA